MKNKLITLLIVGFVLLTLPQLSATSDIIYKQNTDVDVVIPCFFGGNICSDTTTCNISIQYKNGTYMVDFQSLTNLGDGDFKYSLNENQTANFGKHPSKMVCWQGDYNGTSVFTISFTPTGEEIDTGQGITSVGIIIAMILLSGIFGFFGFRFSDSDKLFPIAIFFLITSIIIGLFAMQLAYISSRDILFPLSTEGMQFKILLGIMWGLLGMAFIALLILIIKVLNEFRKRKSMVDNSDGYTKN
ncbi:hypothetical protein ES702_01244 [subsurface metagenome]